jgi:hypothetical protein
LGREIPGGQGQAGQEPRATGLGLWPLVAFAAVSLWAVTGFRGVPELPPAWRVAFGRPPPPTWINAAFVLYLFSALILGLTRLGQEVRVLSALAHLGYLSAFYGFYWVAGVLEDNLWAVLVGGFAILTLEWYRGVVWSRQRGAADDDPLGRG